MVRSDRLVSRSGASAFVTGVIVPELTIMLIKDDMGIKDDEEARAIVKESSCIGDLVNKEEDDLVRPDDEDELSKWDMG